MTLIAILVFVCAVIAVIWFMKNIVFTLFSLAVAAVLIWWLVKWKYAQYVAATSAPTTAPVVAPVTAPATIPVVAPATTPVVAPATAPVVAPATTA